jgi:hypothetical protein
MTVLARKTSNSAVIQSVSKWLIAEFSRRRRAFYRRSGHVTSVVHEVTLGQVTSSISVFLATYNSTNRFTLIHYHHHPGLVQ